MVDVDSSNRQVQSLCVAWTGGWWLATTNTVQLLLLSLALCIGQV